MAGVCARVCTRSAEKPAKGGRPVVLEPMWPALARGPIFLVALATPVIATLLSR